MKDLERMLCALILCGLVYVPARAQEAGSPPPKTSMIQRLIAVDQLVEEKQYEEAVEGYNALLADEPRNAQILNRLGNVYQTLQRLRDAKVYYERALKAEPHFAVAVNNIGCLYYNDKQYGRAARAYRKAIKMDSSIASFHSNLGYAYLHQEKYKEMMTAFRDAVAIDPTIFDQHSRSGAIVLERSVENRGAFYFYLAKTFGQLGDIQRCLEYLRKARDEHFKDILLVKTDPAFAPVRPNPAVKEFMDGLAPSPVPNPSSAM